MKRFYASTYVKYCIARIDKDGEIWYYRTASMCGKDKDGIVRIWNVKWEEYNSDSANYNRQRLLARPDSQKLHLVRACLQRPPFAIGKPPFRDPFH